MKLTKKRAIWILVLLPVGIILGNLLLLLYQEYIRPLSWVRLETPSTNFQKLSTLEFTATLHGLNIVSGIDSILFYDKKDGTILWQIDADLDHSIPTLYIVYGKVPLNYHEAAPAQKILQNTLVLIRVGYVGDAPIPSGLTKDFYFYRDKDGFTEFVKKED